jgi:hypothetical protein
VLSEACLLLGVRGRVVCKDTWSELRDTDKESMGKASKRKWRPYQLTPYDLNRDPTLAEIGLLFRWGVYRELKAKERKRMLTVKEDLNGNWHIIDENGDVLAVEASNSDAWKRIETLEKRRAGRKARLYQSDAATTIVRKIT